ncbi:signal peptidase I [Halovenus sp. WSH3]|uniref:Signal peptidase I n=1 Tax=Halovenus carboxidivorans TaxID=2692199 RepID=A0A6B0TC16_9EURY|nr:signal peptidase I [Halovenus carboxidivorans]MXR50749.1 signal peptidase I [Halovenus carboxidivorans]
MKIRHALWVAAQIILVVVVLALLVGQFLGQPVLLSYVTTDSMEPTIDVGDGFIAVPPELAGDVSEGDVIVFEAEEIQGGGLTTHRVVDETEEGYITRGDNNPFTDQDADEPPVSETQIRAVAWQPGGSVLTIPFLGTAVMWLQSTINSVQLRLAQALGTRALLGTQGIAYLMLGVSVVLYVAAGRFESDKNRERDLSRETGTSSHKFVALLTLIVVAGVTAAMVVPAESQEFGIVSAEFESDSPTVIEQGTNESFNYSVRNTGVLPTVVFLEPAGTRIDTEPRQINLDGRSAANATVTISAPEETGSYRAFVQQYRYLGVLPSPVLEQLYRIHPWVPIVVIDAVVAVPFYLIGIRLLGGSRFRDRSRSRGSWW